MNHLAAACKSEAIKKRCEDNKKKASVKEVSVMEMAPPAVAAASAAAAPAAVLSLVQEVQEVTHTQQPAYTFTLRDSQRILLAD